MNQYDPYSMTTDEKRRQLMEMYNLQFNPQPMQPPKPPRMAALPVGATMATPPAIAFARGPSSSAAPQISAPSASAPFAQQAVEEPMYAGGISGEEFGKMFAAAIRPSGQTTPQASYEAYQAATRRYNSLAPNFERLGRFYGQIGDYAGDAIARESGMSFQDVFSEYIKQITDVPQDLSKSFFDWYANFISGRASAEAGLADFQKKKKEQMAMSQYQTYSQWANRTGRPVASIEEFVRNYDRIAEGAMDQSRRIPLWMLNIRSQPPFINTRTGDLGIPATGRQAPIRPPSPEGMK